MTVLISYGITFSTVPALGGKLTGKRTTQQPAIPQGAIIVAIDLVDIDSEAAEVALDGMKEYIGQAQFDLAMDHLYQLFIWDVLTNQDSQLHGIIRQSMQKLHTHVLDHLHRSHEQIEQLEAEQKNMRLKLSELSGRVHVLESALCSVRKCLKADGVKQAVSYCQRLRKQRPGGETAEAALALADGVKDACICIREM